ncbi:hypothetical protein P5673_007870 [Acropora cervicornis]|uniref:Uncharacterized protein n=1 Tax=Acropora cervicornis TaxID=6130 RepID=A0AAD9QVP6_ACRCE|nr:hypothetical protein P5673_007870 [Acropora cervicornis]
MSCSSSSDEYHSLSANAQTVRWNRSRNLTNAGVEWRSQDAVRRWRRASLRTSALSITLGLKYANSIIGSLKLLLQD